MPVYNCSMALSDDKVYILSPGGVINPDYGFIPTTVFPLEKSRRIR